MLYKMTSKLLFCTVLLATLVLGSVLGSECDEVDALPIQPNCTVKRYWNMYCEVNGQQFTFNNVSVPPVPTRCENSTATVTETTRVTESATVTTTATVTSTEVTTSTLIVPCPSPTSTANYRDCKDALERGMTQSGVYTVQPDSLQPFDVYCDQDTDGGGWTVCQRRQDGSEDFYRNWANYSAGFGNLSAEFWLGLKYIHRLTGMFDSELRVDLGDFENNTRYSKYSSFKVDNALEGYKLSVSGYEGTGEDSLTYNSGMQFTTFDQDNDISGDNCANLRQGAWWFRQCSWSNLNGRYYDPPAAPQYLGVQWHHWKGAYYSLKFSEMKVRRHSN